MTNKPTEGPSERARRPLSPEQVSQGLRARILNRDPASPGIAVGPDHPVVWGVLMEFGRPNGAATLVAQADGTTSLYWSTGGGIIGGGPHPAVATAVRSFFLAVESHLPDLEPSRDTALPSQGRVIIRALTYAGRLSAEVPEDDLGHGRHPLSPVFYAGQRVITALRLIDEARKADQN